MRVGLKSECDGKNRAAEASVVECADTETVSLPNCAANLGLVHFFEKLEPGTSLWIFTSSPQTILRVPGTLSPLFSVPYFIADFNSFKCGLVNVTVGTTLQYEQIPNPGTTLDVDIRNITAVQIIDNTTAIKAKVGPAQGFAPFASVAADIAKKTPDAAVVPRRVQERVLQSLAVVES